MTRFTSCFLFLVFLCFGVVHAEDTAVVSAENEQAEVVPDPLDQTPVLSVVKDQSLTTVPLAIVAGAEYPFFDDSLISAYARKIANSPKEVLLAMINDDALAGYRKAAAVRVFRERFASQVVSRERAIVERILLRRFERDPSIFVQIEVMHTLVILDRYRYFETMVPLLIQKIDHYDLAVTELAYSSIVHINELGNQRTREARIVFNTLRKIFFLMRKKLQDADETDPRLKDKLELLRWSVKVLGTQELKTLPKEVISLM